jgi:hypothetical protein
MEISVLQRDFYESIKIGGNYLFSRIIIKIAEKIKES